MQRFIAVGISVLVCGLAAWWLFGNMQPTPNGPTATDGAPASDAVVLLQGNARESSEETTAGGAPTEGVVDTREVGSSDDAKLCQLFVRVIRAKSLKPVADARVVVDDGDDGVHESRSDETGVARFEGVAPGKLSVQAFVEGCVPSDFGFADLVPGAVHETSVRVQRGVPLLGRVLSAADHTPIAGARIVAQSGGEVGDTSMSSGEPYPTVTSDAAGAFRVPAVPLSTIFSLTILARGYARTQVSREWTNDQSKRPVLVIEMPVGGMLRGQVLGPDGHPVEQAAVYVFPEGPRRTRADPRDEGLYSGVLTARTDAEGRYEIDGLAHAAVYGVTAFGRLFARAEDVLGIVSTPDLPDVTADLTLRRPSRLDVIVLNESGEPVTEATVQTSRNHLGHRTPGADGRVRFECLAPGPLRVSARAVGLLPTSLRVAIAEGAGLERTLTLRKGVVLSGTLVDDEDKPITGAYVSVGRKGGDRWPLAGAKTDEQGRFSIEGLEPAPHAVDVRARGYTMKRVEDVDVPTADLALVAQRMSRVKVHLIPISTAPGEVWVGVYDDAGGGGGSGTAWGDGRFEASIRAGPHTVRIEGPGFGPYIRRVDLPPGTELDLGTVRLGPGVHLAGVVVDGADRPVAGATLEPQQHLSTKAESHRDGSFRLTHLHADALRIQVHAEGYLGHEIERPAGAGSADDLRIQLSTGGVVSGRVLNVGGRGLSELTVTIKPIEGRSEDPNRQAWPWTDERGAYDARLAPGRYKLTVQRPGQSQPGASAEVTITEGKVISVDLVVRED